MSCKRNAGSAANAARRNGISGQISRFLNILGSWNTYQDLPDLAKLPTLLEEKTEAYFGTSFYKKDPFSAWLAKEMKAKDLSKKELVEKSGASRATVSSWLKDRTTPGPKNRQKIAEALDISITEVEQRLKEAGSGLPLPRVNGILGAIVAVHTLEQATGAAATFGMRLLARGKPIGKHRGVILRQSPLTPRAAKMVNRLTRGRLQNAEGYYFFESGRTWHSQSLTVRIGDEAKTLMQVRSYSIPYREFYFDRTIPPQDVVDVVLNYQEPDTIPGYIGRVNELENLGGLGHLKRAFFVANWFLVDESERDGGSEYVDYGDLGGPKLGGGGYVAPSRRPGGSGGGGSSSASRFGGERRPDMATAYRQYGAQGYSSDPPAATAVKPQQSYGGNLFSSAKPAANNGPPTSEDGPVTARVHLNGKDYPVKVERVMTNPVTKRRLADAYYYDGQEWRYIDDEETQEKLAKAVDRGQL